MQIQLSWVRRALPRPIQPIAKGTNTLVFATSDPDIVDVFLMCPTKYEWWKECGLVLNPDDDHFFDHVTVKGWHIKQYVTHDFVLRRVQAKKLFPPEKGSPQKREIAATVKAMEKIWHEILGTERYSFNQHRNWSNSFWNRVSETDLPTQEMADFCTNYFVVPDLATRNALVDAEGNVIWSDLFVDEKVMEFCHMRSKR